MTTLEQARSAATRIGYPVALKVLSPQITHKSDVGGVVLVADEGALDAGYQTMLADVAEARPDATVDGVLVEQVLGRGVEMIISARRDPAWGEFLMVGLGGLWTEVLKDVVVIPADATREEIAASIASLRGFEALTGTRGGEPSDVGALVDAVETVGGLLRAAPAIREIEVNPLLVLPRGGGTAVLDAVIVATT
ncbi:MAG: acetate--CoA ligase family protein [Acidobacteriota bacterium]|nr:acetate--CoA ligase family protein [Acidobacteriota bacterium]